MSLPGKISVLIRFLRLSAVFTWKGLIRILGFFTSGIYSYILMFFYVIWSNRNRTIEEVALRLAEHDILVSEGLATVLGGATGLSYGDAVFQVFNSTIFILWYIRTGAFLVKIVGGDNLPPLYRWGIAVSAYIVGVFSVSGRLPLAFVDLVLNFESLTDLDRLNPFTDRVKVLNGSEASVNRLNVSEFFRKSLDS